jgi:formylglycine-generating enzyme required for sulfatase activity
MYRCSIFFLLLAALAVPARANNIQISNISLTGQNTTSNFTMVEFDITWEHSWRDNGNWDAAWLFIKWSTDNGYTWNHASLNAAAGNHTAPSGSTLVPAADSTGVLIHRAAAGSGTVNWTNVQLRWDYGNDYVADNAVVLVKVFGTEMVYIPTEGFSLGDGTTSLIAGQFEAGNSGDPFQITSEGALTLGGTAVTNLSNHDRAGMVGLDDYTYTTTQSLPAAYPKGYSAFYVMKYEITQEQYKDFLNTLSRTQQIARVGTDISGTAITNRFVMSNTTTLTSRNGLRCDATLSTSDPITIYCDFDGDGVYDEATDGQNIVANYLTRDDVKAFQDWAALRPMSELEFEKAARGPIPPRINEWAWGDTTYIGVTTVANSGSANEVSTTSNANVTFGGSFGVIRAGAFATASSARRAAGASYYGVMELSGNVWDQLVATSNSTMRGFQGAHGDGELNSAGLSDAGWPILTCRGGSWNSGANKYQRTSDRSYANTTFATRSNMAGGRGARTAP